MNNNTVSYRLRSALTLDSCIKTADTIAKQIHRQNCYPLFTMATIL